MADTYNIGIEVVPPKDSCTDARCPFHGGFKVKGRVLKGIIVSKDMHKSATLETERMQIVRKYERYMKKKTRVRVHNPPCINAQVGDEVRVMECRPISKTKNFVIIEKLGHDVLLEQKIKEEAEEKGKKPKKAESEKKVEEE
jgi:small subunit ribosomal protein S17